MTVRRLLAVALLALVAASTSAAQTAFPSEIGLPDGFRPEGIAVSGQTFYTGSLGNGAIYRGNLRTGQGAVFVPAGPANAPAVGMKADRKRLFRVLESEPGLWREREPDPELGLSERTQEQLRAMGYLPKREDAAP